MPLVNDELDFHVLAEIHAMGRDYSYAIWKRLKERWNVVETNESTLLNSCKRLFEQGLIEQCEEHVIPYKQGVKATRKRIRKYYSLTDLGRLRLRLKVEKAKSLMGRLGESVTRVGDFDNIGKVM